MATTKPEKRSTPTAAGCSRASPSKPSSPKRDRGAEIVERAFALTLDRGGMRRTWLRGRDNVQKRYLIHIAGYSLGLIMRLLTDSGTPRRWAGSNPAVFWLWLPVDGADYAIYLAILTNDHLLPLTSACIVIKIAER